MELEYKSCPFCHQPSSVAQGKCYACGATVPESLKPTREPSGEDRPARSAGSAANDPSQTRKRPRRVVFGWLFLSVGMVMMLFFGFIFNSKLIYMEAFGQATETITKNLNDSLHSRPMRRPSVDAPGWFLDPGQLEENGMRLGMVFWMSGMLCILLPKQKAD